VVNVTDGLRKDEIREIEFLRGQQTQLIKNILSDLDELRNDVRFIKEELMVRLVRVEEYVNSRRAMEKYFLIPLLLAITLGIGALFFNIFTGNLHLVLGSR